MYTRKKLGSSIGIVLLTLIVGLVSIEAFHAYIINHQYYIAMSNWSNRGLALIFILLALLPLSTILRYQKFSLRNFGRSLLTALLASGYVHVAFKGGFVGGGFSIFLFNSLILLTLIAVVFGGLYALGGLVYQKYIKPDITHWSDILIALGGGLGIFLLLNYILIFTHLFYRPLARLQLGGFIYLIISRRSLRTQTNNFVTQEVSKMRALSGERRIIFGILIVLTIVYMLYGFNLSFIPYSTAWDANHAYMYFPKVRSLNNGLFFKDGVVVTPYLWMTYIAYFFSLWKPFGSAGLLSPDTIAVVMNNISGRLALVFGLGAAKELLNYFKERNVITTDNQSQSVIGFSWMRLLLRLMSGMGAFLVFVDNKTDLGVMSLTMLALLTGFQFLRTLHHSQDTSPHQVEKTISRSWRAHIPALLSAFFFALAISSKPTAFQDAAIFLLLLIGIAFGILGSIGLFLLILAVLGKAETMSMVFYVSKRFATKIGIVGALTSLAQVFVSGYRNIRQRFKPIFTRGVALLIFLVVIKGSYTLSYQLVNHNFSLSNFAKGILLGDTHQNSIESQQQPSRKGPWLLADSGQAAQQLVLEDATPSSLSLKANQCTLSQVGLTQDTLYDGLQDIVGGGLTEDFGRYIGFGQRVFTDPQSRTAAEAKSYGRVRIGYPLLKLLFPTPGCYSLNTVADTLCQQPNLGESASGIQQLMSDTPHHESNQYKFLEGIVEKYQSLTKETDPIRQQSLQTDINQTINSYVQGNVVKVDRDENGLVRIAVPYAFLTPLNVIFNWSLQNLSSYYTDIGFVRIISLILLIAGTIASIYTRQRELLVLHLVTIAGWILWWFLASGIIWYAVGIIVWTTFCNALSLALLLERKNSSLSLWATRILIGIIIVIALIQTAFNLIRISSQGGGGPFVWYKGHTGKSVEFLVTSQGYGQEETIEYNYGADDVFHEQFGHYESFLNATKGRSNEDGILVAGTYLQYFLPNQHNIIADGLLTEFWKRGSDDNSCKLDLRLKDKNIKYLVIDPNIGSVVMGEGNQSLFDRFFAKIDSASNTIINHGALTMLAQLVEDNYLRLVTTNNLGAQYAFSLSDNDLAAYVQAFGDTGLLQQFEADPILLRAKLAVPRFFPEEGNNLFEFIAAIFQSRLFTPLETDPQVLGDIANILGKQISIDNVMKGYLIIKNPPQNTDLRILNSLLNSDERTVLGYYMTMQRYQENNDAKSLQGLIGQLLQRSLASGSQIIAFERIN